MTREELIRLMSEDANINNNQAEAALKSFINHVTAALKAKDKLNLIGFGVFEVAERAARTGRNPKTGEPLKIAASSVPKFRPGKNLKDAVSSKGVEATKKATAVKAKSDKATDSVKSKKKK